MDWRMVWRPGRAPDAVDLEPGTTFNPVRGVAPTAEDEQEVS